MKGESYRRNKRRNERRNDRHTETDGQRYRREVRVQIGDTQTETHGETQTERDTQKDRKTRMQTGRDRHRQQDTRRETCHRSANCVSVHLSLVASSSLQMIIALAGYLTGYDGSFSFKEPGLDYNDTNYIGMRTVRGSISKTLRLSTTCHITICVIY